MERKRIDGINLIRILSMITILLFHARLLYGFLIGIEPVDNVFSIGAICVGMFFVLSGFGLRKSYRGLDITDTSAVRGYIVKRLLSIYPLYFLLQVIAILFSYRTEGFWKNATWLLPVQLTMTQVFIGPDAYPYLFNDNCWYLSALFVLYLLFPFLNATLEAWKSTYSKKWLIILIVVLCLLSECNYLYQIHGVESSQFLSYYPNPIFRIPEFYIGMLAADLSEDKLPLLEKRHVSLVTLVVSFVIGFIGLQILYPYVGLEYNLYNIIVLPCAVITILCLANNKRLNLIGGHKLANWIAGMGLEIYLCQSLAILVIERMEINSHHAIWFIGLSVVIAVVVHVGYSRNVRKWIKR